MRRQFTLTLCGVLVSLPGLTTQVRADILPPGGSYAGRTYNDWQVLWWQTAFATPVVNGDHPLFSGGVLGERDGVVMLTGVFGTASLNLTIPNGTAIFFPVINAESSVFEPPPFHGDDEASLRANSVSLLGQTTGRFAQIDGVPVDLTPFRFVSPLFTWGPLPADNILGAPAGTTSDAVDAGYYLLLTNLTPGSHTIHFGGTFGGPVSGSIDTTYNVTVVPEPSTLALISVGGLALAGWRRWKKRATV